jgi:hypothetical protein
MLDIQTDPALRFALQIFRQATSPNEHNNTSFQSISNHQWRQKEVHND